MTSEKNSESEGQLVQLSQNAPIEVFPFVTLFHCQVILRHHDDESQDIEMTPDEADNVANLIKIAAALARRRRQNA